MAKRYSPQLLAAAFAGGLLLLFWTTRRPPAPAHGPDPAAPELTSAGPVLSPSAAFPQAETAPASAAAVRLELLRRCLRTAETDPLAAMEFALKNKLTADDPGLLTSLILQWASHDFDAACDWTKAQPADAWRDHTLAHFAYLRAQTDPVAAARLALTDISAGPARDEAIISVVHQWTLHDSETAKAWADSFQDDKLKTRALAEIQGLRNRGLSDLRNEGVFAK
jgi:hypothetical protein